ncbi:MAG: hypothetical protein FJ293_16375 [Planctomycetes bacterium]|nr:hypothetical protein [Planctomycetota bacterium]
MPARTADSGQRARRSPPLRHTLLLPTLLALAPAAEAQQSGTAASDHVVPADTIGWQSLAQDLFLSGESSLVDPGRIEPLPRNILKFGAVELLPKFDEQLVYDDNLFLTENDREGDFILRSGIGLLADYRFGQGAHRLSAGGDATRHTFLGDDADDFTETLLSAQLELTFRRLAFALGNRFEDRTDPLLSVFTGKIERTINTVHGRAGWNDDDRKFELRGQRSTTEYDDDAFTTFDRDEDLLALEGAQLVDEDAWAFARIDLLARSFDQGAMNDMDGVAASVGLRMKRGDDIDGMARLGLRAERFDDGVATDSDDSAISPELEARLRWWLVRSAALELRVERTTEFSPVSNYQTATRGEATWMQQLEQRLSARLGGGIEHVDPSSTDPTFFRYTLGAGLRYAVLENADLTLAWRLRLRNTSAANGDYTGNQLTLGFSLRL